MLARKELSRYVYSRLPEDIPLNKCVDVTPRGSLLITWWPLPCEAIEISARLGQAWLETSELIFNRVGKVDSDVKNPLLPRGRCLGPRVHGRVEVGQPVEEMTMSLSTQKTHDLVRPVIKWVVEWRRCKPMVADPVAAQSAREK